VTVELRRTALTDRHEAAGAKLAPFAGWAMPIQFAGALVEHDAVRSSVGIFDVSHLGTVWIEGADALATIAASFTNDPTALAVGASHYTLCCDDQGGIVDDLIVYRLEQERFLAVPNASNTAAVVRILRQLGGDREVGIRDESGDWAVLAVQGPDAIDVLDRLVASLGAATAVSALPYLGVGRVSLAGHEGLVCRTGYTGEPGAELVVPGAAAAAVWDTALELGAVACGLGARDSLRLEMGYPLHGNDLSTEVTPYEARLGWAVKLDREDFRGRQALVAAKEAGPSRRLWGLLAPGRRPARAGMDVSADGAVVGLVTSGGFSPTLGRGIALALLDASVRRGDTLSVDVRGTGVEFEVVQPPFVERDPRG
jgi:aminomethyltransferase